MKRHELLIDTSVVVEGTAAGAGGGAGAGLAVAAAATAVTSGLVSASSFHKDEITHAPISIKRKRVTEDDDPDIIIVEDSFIIPPTRQGRRGMSTRAQARLASIDHVVELIDDDVNQIMDNDKTQVAE